MCPCILGRLKHRLAYPRQRPEALEGPDSCDNALASCRSLSGTPLTLRPLPVGRGDSGIWDLLRVTPYRRAATRPRVDTNRPLRSLRRTYGPRITSVAE